MDDKKSDLPKQKTPKGYEIPVPTKGEFEAVLDKVAKAPKPKPSDTRRSPKK